MGEKALRTPKSSQDDDPRERREHSIASRIEWLDQVELFHDLHGNRPAMQLIAELMDVRHLPPGAAIIVEGQEGSDAYFLTKGRVRVVKMSPTGDSFPVAILEAKDHPFFGESAVLQSDQRSATITTETACECMIFHKQAFDRLASEHPDWALPVVLRIARVVLERLRKSNHDVILLYTALVDAVRG